VGGQIVVVVCNFTPVLREGYRLALPQGGMWREVLNTDAQAYWGSGKGNAGIIHADRGAFANKPASALVTLPPLATVYFVSE
jgi:1,4-alpha-glucan branching enzyme